MRLLVLGGTAWLGREVTAAALARGHEVVCLARGRSGAVVPGAELVAGDRDEPGAHAALPGRFDATIDVARHPGQVRRAVAELGDRHGHFVLVSTGNVYAEPAGPGDDESAPLLEPLDGDRLERVEDYGAAKVACERAVPDGLIVRPGLIGGPGDASGRSGYWPWRFARDPQAPVVVPDDPQQPIQVIDVRDLARWLVAGAEAGLTGAYDAVGPRSTLGALLDSARASAGHTGPLVPVAPDRLAAAGVHPWMGPRSLPLWLGDDAEGRFSCDRDGSAARVRGLAHRPVEEMWTGAAATYADLAQPRPGLTDEEQAELLEAI